MNLDGPALAAQEAKQDERSEQALAIALKGPVTDKRIYEANRFFKPGFTLPVRQNTGVKSLKEIWQTKSTD